MFKWKLKAPITAQNAIFLEDGNDKEGRPFKARFLQPGLVKYDFGVCLLQKETIDKFINTFINDPVIIDHKDFINPDDVMGKIQNIWFSPEDGWFWCDGIITDEKAVELIENGYNVSCQYRITDFAKNTENRLHNGNPYDKEILNGVFEHLAIVKNPRYEGAFIAANAYIASNGGKGSGNFDHDGRPGEVGGSSDNGGDSGVNPNYKEELKQVIQKAKENPNERQNVVIGKVSEKLQQKAKENGFDLSNYNHDIDVSGTRHSLKHHGNKKKEESRGQIAITDEDFERIPEIIYGYDEVSFGEEDNKGTPLVKYKKDFPDGSSVYVEEIRTRQKTLTIKSMYKTKKASNSSNFTDFNPQRLEYTSNIIIALNSTDFNPIDFINKLDKGEQMDEKLKELCAGFAKALLKAKNEADEEKEKTDEEKKKEKEEKEKEAENKAKNEEKDAKDKEETASNEDTDKRKLIDEIGGILKGKVDEELWRTIIGKAEKLAYTKSEAGTADNKAKNKCKNKDETKEGEYDKLKEEIFEEVKNQIAKNSMDALKSSFYAGGAPEKKLYVSQKEGLELGKQIYG